jgi:phenylpyruvate tautomerase
MPLLKITTNLSSVSEKSVTNIHKNGGSILAEELNKSIQYVMVVINHGCKMSFAGDAEQPSAYLEVKNVGGLTPVKTQSISSRLTSFCASGLKIKPERIYIDFQQSERHMWGWNGNTFA